MADFVVGGGKQQSQLSSIKWGWEEAPNGPWITRSTLVNEQQGGRDSLLSPVELSGQIPLAQNCISAKYASLKRLDCQVTASARG